jgi:hypothetical protein
MPAGFVLQRRVGSDYRRSDGLQRLGASRRVCHCPKPLSLDLSLAFRIASEGITQCEERDLIIVGDLADQVDSRASWGSDR